MSSPHCTWGSAYDDLPSFCLSGEPDAIVAPRRNAMCSLAGMIELAAKPSHYAHFCALSRYGVTTERSYLTFDWISGIRDVGKHFDFVGWKWET